MEAQLSRERSEPPPRPPQPQSSSQPMTDYKKLSAYHDNAFKLIEQGLSADAQGKIEEAIPFYSSGLDEIAKALAISCEELDVSAERKAKARKKHLKMIKSQMQINDRLVAIRETVCANSSSQAATNMVEETPPTYEEATSLPLSQNGNHILDEIMFDEADLAHQSLVADATAIFSIPDGVQIFYITPEGYVSAPSYPSSLNIYKFTKTDQPEEATNQQRPPAFLQVGDWMYPLAPNTSPALHTSYGGYVFPDTNASQPGCSVGLILPDTVSPEEKAAFENLLSGLTALRDQEHPVLPQDLVVDEAMETETPEVPQTGDGQRRMSTKISNGLTVAAEWISWGVGKGAEKAGEMINKGSKHLQQRLIPEDQPSKIDPKVQKGLLYARQATNTAVKVSGFLVRKLGDATAALGKQIAPHVRKEAEKLFPAAFAKSKDGTSKMDCVAEVAASGLKGFGTVYMSLEAGATALGRSLANETVHLVSHKYGAEAGKVTENTVYSVGNIAMAGHNINSFGPKVIAKRAAKDAGKAIIHERVKKMEEKDEKEAKKCDKEAKKCDKEAKKCDKEEKKSEKEAKK